MKSVIAAFVLTLALSLLSIAQSDSGCNQIFTLFDKTKGDYALMFYRTDWEGTKPCGQSTFYTLFILPDRVHAFSSNGLIGNWVPRLYANLPLEEFEIVIDSGGTYCLNDTIYMSVPEPDSTFDRKFLGLPQRDAKTWYWTCTDHCYDSLVFRGANPERIYTHPGGLYKNCSIKEVRYYKTSNYLIILTEHPFHDYKNRSMNGLIIYNLNGWEWLR